MSKKAEDACSANCSSNEQCPISKNKKFLVVILPIVVFLSIYYISLDSFAAFAEKNFDLGYFDLVMIPVGSLLFFIFWKLMEAAVFKDFLNLYNSRELATVGSNEETARLQSETANLRVEYNDKLASEKKSALNKKADLIEHSKKEAANEIKEATTVINQQAEAKINKSIDEINQEKEELFAKVSELAEEVSQKITKEKTFEQEIIQ